MSQNRILKQTGQNKRPIIIRRPVKKYRKFNAGTWKLAYADFVTALMAFFLLLWLITLVSNEQLKVISEYFQNPVSIKLPGGPRAELQPGNIVVGGDGGGPMGDGRGRLSSPDESSQEDARQHLRQLQLRQFNELKNTLEQVISANPNLASYRNQIRLTLTNEGLRILIFDDMQRPMFEIGKSTPLPYTAEILRAIGGVLNQISNKISLSGHTDAMPYAGGELNYSNWELSTDRDNASRRELVAGGLEVGRISRVVGLASSVLLDPADPFNPINRRISIIVMAQEAAGNTMR